jgi:acyl-CoA synthetase (AMP-forming)/AMP-acid ligase II
VWRLLEHPDIDRRDLDCVGNVGIGGAPFSPELQARVLERFPTARLTNGYGMTETTGTGTWLTGGRIASHPSSVGAATPGQSVQVRDPSGRVLPAGEVGEICIRGAGVFLGYLDDPEATAAALDGERWYRTGDFGRIDGDVLYLESRMRDLIIRGGENVYPLEIEHRITAHPDVVDAAVVGLDHPALGQEVRAVVVARPGSGLDAAAVRSWVAETLAPFKVPAVVDLVDSLPYTATGKVQKHLLTGDPT